MTNPLKLLVLHCTATPQGRAVSAQQVHRWHTAPPPEGRGWDRTGYRCLVLLDGSIHRYVAANRNAVVEPGEVTWGVGPAINPIAHHICYVGGLAADGKSPADTRTPGQGAALAAIVRDYLSFAPDIRVAGHYHFAPKACPSFDVEAWCREIGVPERNIYRKGMPL